MRFTENKLVAWGTVAGAVLMAISLVSSGVIYQIRMSGDVDASRAVDVDHESRLRSIESGLGDLRGDVKVTREDVAWIRKFLDRPACPQVAPQADKDQQTASR